MDSEPPTPPSKTSEALKAQLQAANAGLEKLRREMELLQADNKKLSTKVKESKEETKKALAGERANSNAQAVCSINSEERSHY